MAKTTGAPSGDEINLSGTFHGPVFVKSTFQETVNIAAGLTAPPADKVALNKALADLSASLGKVPKDQEPLAQKVSASAKEVVETARSRDQKPLFIISSKTLRAWAKEIGKTVPAVVKAAEAVVVAVGKIHGWL